MVYILRFLTVLSVAAVGLSLSVKRDFPDLVDSLNDLDSEVLGLYNGLQACSASNSVTSATALDIQIKFTAAITAIDTVATAAKNCGVLSGTQGAIIVTSVQVIEPIVSNALKVLVEIKTLLAALPGEVALTLKDLIALQAAIPLLFADLLSILTTTGQQGAINAVEFTVNVSLSAAVTAFSS